MTIPGWRLLQARHGARLPHHGDVVRIDLLEPRRVFSCFTLTAATPIVHGG
ncbi:hypothetical protein HNQ51_002323 [Inhella inkyongensis]|uniref:Uncharacterized protein n=1 Tax=Inhella inkyongensis TaxID=392593 RepID=A0A840S879_9BURK|nr:hypothetical protein [Inhella inkyongensis]MBB5205004.1 hypothetical protein [Inhella inkyongensis]